MTETEQGSKTSLRTRLGPAMLIAAIAAIVLIPAGAVSAATDRPPEAKMQPVRSEAGGRQPLVLGANHRSGNKEITYQVRGDQLRSKRGKRIVGAARRIWTRFVQLVPSAERTHLRKFSIFKGSFAGAYVAPLRRNASQWKLGVFQKLRPYELDFVLVHEFGHLLTLKATQVPPGGRGGGCTTYFPGEGCALADSYLALYVREFWQDNGRLAEWQQAQKGGRKAQNQFYQRYKDEFITSYAPSHPAEDVAESWAAFVVADSPTGSTVADEKVRFFERFPELVALRAEMRKANPSPEILE